MAIIALVHLPVGYDPRQAVKIWWIWPQNTRMEAKNTVAIEIEVADDLLLDNLELVKSKRVSIRGL